jgi:hypothetical protein
MPSASLGDPSLPMPLVLYASKVLTLALYSPLSLRFGLCSSWIDSSSEIGSFFACFHFSGVIRKGVQRSRAMQGRNQLPCYQCLLAAGRLESCRRDSIYSNLALAPLRQKKGQMQTLDLIENDGGLGPSAS